MSEMLGADPAQLRELAQGMIRAGEDFEDAARLVTLKLDATEWVGPDSQRFRDVWHEDHRPTLVNSAHNLISLGRWLTSQAKQQEKTSQT